MGPRHIGSSEVSAVEYEHLYHVDDHMNREIIDEDR